MVQTASTTTSQCKDNVGQCCISTKNTTVCQVCYL